MAGRSVVRRAASSWVAAARRYGPSPERERPGSPGTPRRGRLREVRSSSRSGAYCILSPRSAPDCAGCCVGGQSQGSGSSSSAASPVNPVAAWARGRLGFGRRLHDVGCRCILGLPLPPAALGCRGVAGRSGSWLVRRPGVGLVDGWAGGAAAGSGSAAAGSPAEASRWSVAGSSQGSTVSSTAAGRCPRSARAGGLAGSPAEASVPVGAGSSQGSTRLVDGCAWCRCPSAGSGCGGGWLTS